MSNKIKRNAIKAASVGMAAMMAATPLTAFAAEPETEAPATEGVAAEKLTDAKTKEETTYAVGATKAGNAALADTQQTIGVEQEDGDKVDYAEESLAEAQKNINTMKSENKTADEAEADNQDLVNKANGTASDAKADMNQAAADFAAKRNEVNNAATIADANAASAGANEVAEQAQKDFAEAEKNYNDLVEKIKTNNAVIATAQEHYEQARKEGGDNLASAEAELEMAKLLAEQYEADAQAASERLAASGAALIINAQEAVDNASSGVWTKRDQLFDTIIKEYYVPNVLEGTVESVSKFVRPTEAQVGSIVYAKNGESQEANYVEVIYTDKDGNKGQKLYLNYKVEDGKLLIFAKEKLDVKYYNNSETNKRVFITDEEFEAAKAIGNDKYVLLDNGTSLFAIEPEHKEGKVTVTKTVNNTDAATYTLDENGNVVETITGEVTTVTKTEKKLDGSEYKYKDADEAKKAAENAIKAGLADGETVVGDVSVETSYETTSDVTYDAVFTATIDIKGWKEAIEWHETRTTTIWTFWGDKTVEYEWFKEEADQEAEARAAYANRIVSIISNAGYEVVNAVNTGNVKMDSKLLDGKWGKKTFFAEGNTTITVTFKKAGLNAGKVTTKDGASADSKAQENANTAIASVNPSIAGVNVNKKEATNVRTSNATSKYAYTDYEYTTTKSNTQNEMVSKKSYEAAQVQHDIGYYSNEHFYSYLDNKEANKGDILLFEKSDEKFNNFLAEHKAEVAKQNSIAAKAQAATKLYVAAQGRVTALQNQLDELDKAAKSNDAVAIAKRAELEVALAQAENDLKTAKNTLDAITGQLTAVATDLANRIAFLTPAPAAPAAPAAVGGAVAVDANVAAAPARLVRVNPVAAPLANTTLDNNGDGEEQDVNLQNLVDGEEVKTALSDMTLEDDAKANTILGWWWLLIVAVLGGTGYTMYRKFQQKKVAEKIDKTK